MDIDISQILSQIVAFLVMLWVLTRFGWKPLITVLESRKEKIQSEFDQIAEERKEVEALKEEYNQKLKKIDSEARHKVQEAIMQGRKIADEIQDEAHVNAKAILFKAKSEADRELVNAKKQFRDDMVNIAISAAEKLLNEKLDDPTQKKLVSEFVDEIEGK